jgi:hypothetical protein
VTSLSPLEDYLLHLGYETYVAHVLGLGKSYWPKGNLSPLSDDMSADYSEDKFSEFVEEVKSVARKLVDSLE